MVKLKNGFTGERALVLPRMIVDKLEEDPLTSMLHITDIGYYPKAKHHFRERKEPINQYVFIYCIDGAGWYRIGEQEYTVSANQYFILLSHYVWQRCGIAVYSVVFLNKNGTWRTHNAGFHCCNHSSEY